MSLSAAVRLWFYTAIVAFGGTVIWALNVVRSLDNLEQRALVPNSTVWGMHLAVFAMIAGLGALIPTLRQIAGKRALLTALAVIVVAWFAIGLAPRTHRIFFDEHIYLQVGQTIAHTGLAEGANYARVEHGQFEMYSPWTNKQPNGWPYLVSWLYRFWGVSVTAALEFNRMVIAVGAGLICLALSVVPWSLPRGAGPTAGVLFAFTPLVPWWGHTAAVEPSAAATAIMAFFAACLYTRLRDEKSVQGQPAAALLLAGAVGFAIYFRPESMLVFPLVAAVLWSTEDRFIEDRSAWGALLVSVALALPNVLHLFSMRTEDWGATDGRRFDFDFVAKNLDSNAGYFVDGKWFPLAGSLLLLAGAGWLLGRARSAGVALAVWFAISWGIFVLFYAGGYHYGASSRYGVISCAPIAIGMGIGATALWSALKRWRLVQWGLVAAVLINWSAAFHFVPTLSREAIEALADTDFVAATSKHLPTGSLVISHIAPAWQLEGVNSTQYFPVESMLRTQLSELANQYPGGVYLHWGFWENAEPPRAENAAHILVDLHAQEVVRTTSHAHILALYRLDTPEALRDFGGPTPATPRRYDSNLDALRQRFAEEAGASPTP